MNKNIKIVLGVFILFSSFLLFSSKVSANTIDSIDMDVFIDANGDANITETWKAYLSDGTEGYRPYTNLSDKAISDFNVTDDSGVQYKSLSWWDINDSFDSKAYKSGIHNIIDGVELCWGISKYGSRTYILKYNIKNFVTQYTDTQGIYFNFLNLDQSVGNSKVTIHSDNKFSLDNARIWSFGNDGTINFSDGNIVIDSGYLSQAQYIVGLIRFQSNLFNVTNQKDETFDSVYDSAMSDISDEDRQEDSIDYGRENNLGIPSVWFYIFAIPLYFIFNPIVWFILYFLLIKLKGREWIWGSNRQSGELNFGPSGTSLPNDKNINYFRDIPCNKDLERAYWVCLKYEVVSEKKLKQGIIGAILLKWIKNGYIMVSKTKKGLFSFKDNNYAVDLTKMVSADNEIENSLFEILVAASGNNNILEAKEFEKWCKKNYNKVSSWFNSIKSKEQSYLEAQGIITETTEEVASSFGKTKTITVKNVNEVLRDEAIQLKGLEKFLLDFSLIPERQYYEVHIWEEYLIFAELMGIADKVSEQFSKLYPQFKEESVLNTDMAAFAAIHMAEIGYRGFEEGVRIAARRASSGGSYSGSSRSSGGGGSSYSSGGGSSGGSSGGGFR